MNQGFMYNFRSFLHNICIIYTQLTNITNIFYKIRLFYNINSILL